MRTFKWVRIGDMRIPYTLRKVCGKTKHDDGIRWRQAGPPRKVTEEVSR